MSKDDVLRVVDCARVLVAAYDRRNRNYDFDTLAEKAAMDELFATMASLREYARVKSVAA